MFSLFVGLARCAWTFFVSYLGTSSFGAVVPLFVVVIALALKFLRARGRVRERLADLRNHWKANIRDSVVALVLVYLAVYLFCLVYKAPRNVWDKARSTRPPVGRSFPKPPPWVLRRYPRQVEPSFVYIVPVFWSPANPARWFMGVQHSGPDPVFNIEILFVDKDRQAEIRKAGTATVQDVEAIETTLHFPEIDPIEIGPKMFPWVPVAPEDEHYEVVITSREGEFREILQIRKVPSGKWQYRMKVTNRTTLIDCRDPEFPLGPNERALPACFPTYVVPGVKRR